MGSYKLKAAWIALLLGLMPRLEMLHIMPTIHDVEFSDYMRPVVSLMRTQGRDLAHDMDQSPKPRLLANLQCLIFDGPAPLGLQCQHVPGIHLDAIFGTPSVKKLILHADLKTIREAYYRDWNSSWGADLLHLELRGPILTNEFMSVVSTHMRKLESFRCTWCNMRKAAALSPHEIFAQLEKLADTLTLIVLDARNTHVAPRLRQRSDLLKGLHKLRYLEVSPAFLLGGYGLHQAFPDSLVHIVLHNPRSRDHKAATKWLCQFLTRHRTLAPGLELLDISQWTMDTAASTSEAQIAATIHADPGLRGKLRLPAWVNVLLRKRYFQVCS